jgi:homoserine dehydrogenase
VVLKEAQRLGYAEADPTFDIEGVDAAHKATILSCHRVRRAGAVRQGTISRASRSCQAMDIRYAEQFGYRIKLLGIARAGATAPRARARPASSCACIPCLVPSEVV